VRLCESYILYPRNNLATIQFWRRKLTDSLMLLLQQFTFTIIMEILNRFPAKDAFTNTLAYTPSEIFYVSLQPVGNPF
jgi:hypothetical protein